MIIAKYLTSYFQIFSYQEFVQGELCYMNFFRIILLLSAITGIFAETGARNVTVYDYEAACELCDELPLEGVEGVWIYPDDNVTVLILNDNSDSPHQMAQYSIRVVETSDAKLHPGELIGKLMATPQEGTYRIELFTERRNEMLLKPKTCIATLSKDEDAFIFKKQKSPLKGRFNLNFSRLLPGFWKMISTGISTANSTEVKVPAGMIKVYPSYDANGSSRRKVRYL